MSLQRKTDPVIFDKACLFAVNNDLLSYKWLQRIIENKSYKFEIAEEEKRKEEDKKQEDKENKGEEEKSSHHENIRGKNYYTNFIQTSISWNS